MGKKTKNKSKLSGAIKTAAKTEKKAISKMKKELANIGEEDIEKVIAELEKEEAKRNAVSEKVLSKPPEPRAYASLTPHPINMNELILFGGECHDGRKTVMYNELLIFNTNTNEWKKIKAPGAPPPRSAHQAIATAANKGELWIFGGEFTSPSETQFYHYKDLWLYSFAEKKWEKVQSPNAPSSRSGHRMTLIGKKIYIFGGYHDNGRDYKYFNDTHCFDLETREWSEVKTAGKAPSPRSGCIFVPGGGDSLLVYGGYSRIKVGKQEQSLTYKDMHRLSRGSGDVWKWSEVGRGSAENARAGATAAVTPAGDKAYVFGGITDVEETEEELLGEMSNELRTLDVQNAKWHIVTLKSDNTSGKVGPSGDQCNSASTAMETEVPSVTTIITDEVFTMKLGGASVQPASCDGLSQTAASSGNSVTGPSPRMNAMIAIQKSNLYIYGGILEKGEKQFTLSDMYCLDIHKLKEWKTLIEQKNLPEWYGSSSEDETSGSDDSESSSEDDMED